MTDSAAPPAFGDLDKDPPLRSEPCLTTQQYYLTIVPRSKDGASSAVDILTSKPSTEIDENFVSARRWLDGQRLRTEQTVPDRIKNSVRRGDLAILTGMGGNLVGGTGLGILVGAAILGGPVGVAAAVAAAGIAVSGTAGAIAKKQDEKYKVSGPSSPSQVAEIRRISCYESWVRDDPIIRLGPGASISKAVRVLVGMSRQTTKEVAGHLGVGSLTKLGVSAQISTKVSSFINVRFEEEVTNTISLQNPSEAESSRRFAIWHVERILVIEALRLTPTDNLRWARLARTSFVPSEAAVVESTGARPSSQDEKGRNGGRTWRRKQ